MSLNISLFIMFVLVLSISVSCKENSDTKKIKLAKPSVKGKTSLEETLKNRRSVRSYTAQDIKPEDIAQLLWSGQGITNKHCFRTAPSGGALYPLDLYLVAKDIKKADIKAGVYHYIPQTHSLELIKAGDIRKSLQAASLFQNCVANAPISIVITAEYKRITKKYGKRGMRYAVIEAGCVSQNISLQATAIGLATVLVGAFNDKDVKDALGIKKDHEPLLILPIGYPEKQ